MSAKGSIEELCARRRQAQEKRDREALRVQYGPKLADALSLAADRALKVADFHVDTCLPMTIIWSRRLEDTPGLVAAYVDKQRALKIVACAERRLGITSGLMGFHDKDYLGFCCASSVQVGRLVAAAEAANDSVVFYPGGAGGVIMVDYYSSNAGLPYSVVVQGDLLIDQLRGCFSEPSG